MRHGTRKTCLSTRLPLQINAKVLLADPATPRRGFESRWIYSAEFYKAEFLPKQPHHIARAKDIKRERLLCGCKLKLRKYPCWKLDYQKTQSI